MCMEDLLRLGVGVQETAEGEHNNTEAFENHVSTSYHMKINKESGIEMQL